MTSAVSTPEYAAILQVLSQSAHPRTASEIAAFCGSDSTYFASGRLPNLVHRGLVNKASRFAYEISDAGRIALAEFQGSAAP